MKNCTRCAHATWMRTKVGKLHPSGNGRCTKEVKIPELPASRHWSYYSNFTLPEICGGNINRNKDLKTHCVYFTEKVI